MIFLDSSFLVLVCAERFCWCFGCLSGSFSRIAGFGEILCGWFSSFVSCWGFWLTYFVQFLFLGCRWDLIGTISLSCLVFVWCFFVMYYWLWCFSVFFLGDLDLYCFFWRCV